MKKVNFLLLFLFCLNTQVSLYADNSTSLFESAYDAEISENVGDTENQNTSTVVANEASSVTEKDTIKKETLEKATKDTTILSGKAYVNSSGWLNLRAKPSKSSKRLAKLYYNDEVNIIGYQNGWYQIDSPKNGYVMAEFVSGSPNSGTNVKGGSATLENGKGYVNSKGWLNLRQKPTKSSKRLAKLYYNDEVNIIGRNGDWYQIDSPQNGWVMAEFISASPNGSSSSSSVKESDKEADATASTGESVTSSGSTSSEPQGGAGSTTYAAGTKGNGTTTLNTLGDTWTVVNTPIGVVSYAKHLQSTKVCQNSDEKKYGSSCLGFSYTHAWGLFTGNKSYTAENGGKSTGAGNFKTLIDDNKQTILKATYDEIMAGRPCILHVNGNKAGTSRHFVTVIGFRASVTSGDTISEEDLLILDSWDAKIERMDQKNSRFMTSGAQCHKSYSGYRIQYMK